MIELFITQSWCARIIRFTKTFAKQGRRPLLSRLSSDISGKEAV